MKKLIIIKLLAIVAIFLFASLTSCTSSGIYSKGYKVTNITEGQEKRTYYFSSMQVLGQSYFKGDTIKYNEGGIYIVDSVIAD